MIILLHLGFCALCFISTLFENSSIHLPDLITGSELTYVVSHIFDIYKHKKKHEKIHPHFHLCQTLLLPNLQTNCY